MVYGLDQFAVALTGEQFPAEFILHLRTQIDKCYEEALARWDQAVRDNKSYTRDWLGNPLGGWEEIRNIEALLWFVVPALIVEMPFPWAYGLFAIGAIIACVILNVWKSAPGGPISLLIRKSVFRRREEKREKYINSSSRHLQLNDALSDALGGRVTSGLLAEFRAFADEQFSKADMSLDSVVTTNSAALQRLSEANLSDGTSLLICSTLENQLARAREYKASVDKHRTEFNENFSKISHELKAASGVKTVLEACQVKEASEALLAEAYEKVVSLARLCMAASDMAVNVRMDVDSDRVSAAEAAQLLIGG